MVCKSPKNLISYLFLGLLLTHGNLFALEKQLVTGEIKYISSESYYIDLGSENGLSVGDTVFVFKNGIRTGKLLVEHLARNSAACRTLTRDGAIEQYNTVHAFIEKKASSVTKPQDPPNLKTQAEVAPTPKRRIARTPSTANKLRGRLSMQTLLQNDRSGTGLDYDQIGFRGRLTVEQFMGLPFEFRMRFRSRGHYRDESRSFLNNDWSHQLYEFGLVYKGKTSDLELGFGRILSNRIRGIGYIDGGLISMKLNRLLRVGFAGGTQPDLSNSSFSTKEQKFGLFINIENPSDSSRRFSSTLAFSGRYHSGEVSREFFYLQNYIWLGRKLSLFQVVELDVNRDWKNDNGRDNLQFSNLYVSGNFSPIQSVSVSLSYDARKNIRVFETRSLPDSLFDAATREGLRSNVSIRLPYRIRLSGGFGIRFQDAPRQDIVSASGGLSVQRPFSVPVTVMARAAYFSTFFSKGYRPSLSVRMNPWRPFSLQVAGGSYIYEAGGVTLSNHWFELDADYRFTRWLFASMGYRLFFDDRLQSGRLFLEAGFIF